MTNTYDKYIVNFVVIAAFIAYFQVFKFIFVPYSLQMLSQIVVNGLIAVLIIFRSIYFTGSTVPKNFKTPVLLILLGAIPSFFIAYYYYQQSFVITLYANKILLFFLLYFFLHLYNVPPKVVLRIIIYIGLLAVFLYLVQMALYPRLIMNLKGAEARGTIRLFVPGLICTIAAYFYFLNRFFETNNLKIFVFVLLTFSVFVLQGTRQVLFSTVFLTLVNLLLSKKVKSKLLMVVLIGMASFIVFLLFRDIFLALGEESDKQSQNIEGDMRVRAATFFLTDFMPSTIAYLFGNSNADSGSAYHLKLLYYSAKYGFYLSDIGIIGDYVRYGVFFIIGAFWVIIKSLTIKIGNEYRFLKYYVAAQCFTLLTGKGFIGGADIVFVSILYLFDLEHSKYINNLKKSNVKIP